MRLRLLIPLLIALTVLGAAVWYTRAGRWRPGAGPAPPDLEREAREAFYRDRPGEKPLNWAIGARAAEFHRTKPMGRFRLHKNDCSDFVDCIIDDALGARARFRRGSTRHWLAPRRELWDVFYWDRHAPLLPGDEISVEHSPHYEPYEGAIWHVGVLGTDRMVYDWSKLKSWPTDRYGRHTVAWFTQHCTGPRSIVIFRLNALYRYKARPLPS
jgi:hypothetical protein